MVVEMDWRGRCLQAEALLAKARAGMPWTRKRREVVRLLGGLRAGQWLDTSCIAEATGVDRPVLREMEALGLVVSRPAQERGFNLLEWQLEHLVTGPAEEE